MCAETECTVGHKIPPIHVKNNTPTVSPVVAGDAQEDSAPLAHKLVIVRVRVSAVDSVPPTGANGTHRGGLVMMHLPRD